MDVARGGRVFINTEELIINLFLHTAGIAPSDTGEERRSTRADKSPTGETPTAPTKAETTC